MDFNILPAGVGGQGILTIAHAISRVAMQHGYHVKQSEMHGMNQREPCPSLPRMWYGACIKACDDGNQYTAIK